MKYDIQEGDGRIKLVLTEEAALTELHRWPARSAPTFDPETHLAEIERLMREFLVRWPRPQKEA